MVSIGKIVGDVNPKSIIKGLTPENTQSIIKKGAVEIADRTTKHDPEAAKAIDDLFKAVENQNRALFLNGQPITSMEEAFIAAGGKFDD